NANGSTNGLAIVGPPGPPEPFDTSNLSRIPLQLLPIPVLLPIPIQGSINPQPPASETPTLTPVVASNGCVPRADWTFTYTVRSGDTLSGIAGRAGISLADLQAGNCIVNANVVSAGQILRVPRNVAPPATRVPPTQPPPTNPPRATNPPQPTAGPTGPNLR